MTMMSDEMFKRVCRLAPVLNLKPCSETTFISETTWNQTTLLPAILEPMDNHRTSALKKKSMSPFRFIFGISKKPNANEQASFGPGTVTPRKSNARKTSDPLIGKHVTINDAENMDPNTTAQKRSTKQKDAKSGLERRRIRWKRGLEMINTIEQKSDLSTIKGELHCLVHYEGIPRNVKFPVGSATWPCGWCQRETIWMQDGNIKSCEVVWFTPLRKKALSSMEQVYLFTSLLQMYGGDEDKACKNLP